MPNVSLQSPLQRAIDDIACIAKQQKDRDGYFDTAKFRMDVEAVLKQYADTQIGVPDMWWDYDNAEQPIWEGDLEDYPNNGPFDNGTEIGQTLQVKLSCARSLGNRTVTYRWEGGDDGWVLLDDAGAPLPREKKLYTLVEDSVPLFDYTGRHRLSPILVFSAPSGLGDNPDVVYFFHVRADMHLELGVRIRLDGKSLTVALWPPCALQAAADHRVWRKIGDGNAPRDINIRGTVTGRLAGSNE